MIQIKKINKYYINGENKLHALKGINFHIRKGEFVSIMGSSGSGKSTMMNILGCLDREFEGEYILDGISIREIPEKNLCKVRNQKIGFVFQSFHLLPKLTALENVELPLVYAGIPKKEREVKAKKMLEIVGLETRMDHRPNELSGGQRQRVAIARALVNDPAIILADEPTGNLDSQSEIEIMNFFQSLHQKGKTIVVVTHEPEVAKYTKRVLHFRDGKLTGEDAL
ncbi:ABC transporter ATP-binding protein [Fusobacterium necrophorum]|uniref:Macrolide ABC transporter ATP-binding protein n=1 Tax=Fusobacterium necrophorum BL TaxID=1441732 RepID=A0AB73BTB7_9FUSO|nr:ABC transporter ATP-binding protein [Fusobacterium necrophorum]AYZ72606.1 ABC transporter ATP-binding protein [Fusobacterium necrophorum]AZW09398.1 ABC transporter ATP-binding protein [Fusobacterium necrophorum subsp. necrophorum]KDE60638.1 macrolide ABC transporter ATP-binding protein [Fusobacterium necrophorum BL]KDE61107.1 macrolide ABC transporter ATP-binding protein [Fusobacterium necrophorum BFTR-1]KDE69882.1 macrolide ABC transporter ATP-binding protein [Fusobacterium necrophorum DAB